MILDPNDVAGIRKAEAMAVSCVGIDFDGVIHRYSGYKGNRLEDLDEPMPGIKKFIETLIAQGIRVKVFTARGTKTGEETRDSVRRWLKKYGFPELEVTNIKHADIDLIIDDRAIQFRPHLVEDDEEIGYFVERVKTFQPYWK